VKSNDFLHAAERSLDASGQFVHPQFVDNDWRSALCAENVSILSNILNRPLGCSIRETLLCGTTPLSHSRALMFPSFGRVTILLDDLLGSLQDHDL
jgi:hypothetical protein